MTLLQTGLVLGESAFDASVGFDLVNLFFKAMFVIAALLYLIFAFVVVRQVHVMKNTLITSFSPVVLVLGYLHFLVALVVLASFILFL